MQRTIGNARAQAVARESAPSALTVFEPRVFGIHRQSSEFEQWLLNQPSPEGRKAIDVGVTYRGWANFAKVRDWDKAVLFLNGMNEPDILRRLAKLNWSQLMAVKSAAQRSPQLGGGERISSYVDQAEAKQRAPRSRQLKALSRAITRQNWLEVATRLNGLSPDDLQTQVGRLSRGQKAEVSAVCPDWAARVTDAISRS